MNISFNNQQLGASFTSRVYMTPDVVELAHTISKEDRASMMQGVEELENNGNDDVVLLSNCDRMQPRNFKMTCFINNDRKLKRYESLENAGPSCKAIVDAYKKVKCHDTVPVKNGQFDEYNLLNRMM